MKEFLSSQTFIRKFLHTFSTKDNIKFTGSKILTQAIFLCGNITSHTDFLSLHYSQEFSTNIIFLLLSTIPAPLSSSSSFLSHSPTATLYNFGGFFAQFVRRAPRGTHLIWHQRKMHTILKGKKINDSQYI